jgi:hypothetical protein
VVIGAKIAVSTAAVASTMTMSPPTLQPAREPVAVLLEDGIDAHAHQDERPATDRTR